MQLATARDMPAVCGELLSISRMHRLIAAAPHTRLYMSSVHMVGDIRQIEEIRCLLAPVLKGKVGKQSSEVGGGSG